MRSIFASLVRWLIGDVQFQLWSEELINHTVGRFAFNVDRPVYWRYRGFWRVPEFCVKTTLVSATFSIRPQSSDLLTAQAERKQTACGEYLSYPPHVLRQLAEDRTTSLDLTDVPWKLKASIKFVEDLHQVYEFFDKIQACLTADPDFLGGKLQKSEFRAIAAFLSNLQLGACQFSSDKG